MGEFIVHRSRFYDFKAKSVQSISYDDTLKKIAISKSDNTIEIWCLKNEQLESIITPSLDRQVEVVLWCQSQLLSAGLDGFIIVYNLSELKPKNLTSSVGGAIWCMCRNKSETKIAIGTEDGYVNIFEMSSDGILYDRSFNKQDSRILSIAWHKDEDILVTGGLDNIRIWDVESGHVTQRIALGRKERNKETLVWCLAITSDYQIISGDSRGKTCIWNAEQATLIKSFQTHSADVLTLCLDDNEENIYCSGIDPLVVQLSKVSMDNEDITYKSWVKSTFNYNHTHDVRSLVIASNRLISAGIDNKLIIKILNREKQKINKYQLLPRASTFDTAANYVLIQYDSYLEIWKLGETLTNDLSTINDGDLLPVTKSPVKLLNLKSKRDEFIVSSAIGFINNTLWISYSDATSIHLYKLIEITEQKSNLSIEKCKSLPLACLKPAICMKFINETNRLCYITDKSYLQTLKIVSNDEFILESCIKCVHDINLTDNRVYSIVCKGDFVATADTDLNVIIWNVKSQSKVCSLPKYDRLVSCMCFDPKNFYLFVAYSNRKIIEFNYELNEYTDWSREFESKLPKEWSKSSLKFRNCLYNPLNLNSIILHDENYIIFVDKNEKLPSIKEKIFTNDKKKEGAIRVSNKYRVS
jgi:U3 small nucleolar RNA-associated protein 4